VIARVVFWGSLGLLVYAYLLYPVLAGIFGTVLARRVRRDGVSPMVSLLIPAYNEEEVLPAKLTNSLSLEYPKDRLEVVVASDGSTDRTCAVAASFADRGVRLLAFPERGGKAALLNRAVPQLLGEVVVFTDASCLLDRRALRRLVSNFADPVVGAVCGRYRFVAKTSSGRSGGEGAYWQFEAWLKRMEGALSSILGAHGALYAIRRFLFQPLPDGAINDDYLIPMRVVEQGYRAIYDESAVAEELTDATTRGELSRRTRITVGNYQQTIWLWRLLNPFRGWIAWQFFSHKVLRTLTPVFLIALLGSSVALMQEPLYAAVFAAQGIFYGMAIVGAQCEQRGRPIGLFMVPFYFSLANLAALLGLLKFLLRAQRPAWEKVR